MSPASPVARVASAAELAPLLADGVVVLCLTGSWCGSCSVFEGAFAEVAGEWGDEAGGAGPGAVCFVEADTQVATDLATAFAVRTVPTVVLLAAGRVVDRIDGPVTRRVLRERVRGAVAEAGAEPTGVDGPLGA